MPDDPTLKPTVHLIAHRIVGCVVSLVDQSNLLFVRVVSCYFRTSGLQYVMAIQKIRTCTSTSTSWLQSKNRIAKALCQQSYVRIEIIILYFCGHCNLWLISNSKINGGVSKIVRAFQIEFSLELEINVQHVTHQILFVYLFIGTSTTYVLL